MISEEQQQLRQENDLDFHSEFSDRPSENISQNILRRAASTNQRPVLKRTRSGTIQGIPGEIRDNSSSSPTKLLGRTSTFRLQNATQQIMRQSKFSSQLEKKPKLLSYFLVYTYLLTFTSKLMLYIRQDRSYTEKHHDIINDVASSYRQMQRKINGIRRTRSQYKTLILRKASLQHNMQHYLNTFKTYFMEKITQIPLIQTDSKLKYIWDIIMLGTRFYLIIVIPLLFAFSAKSITFAHGYEYMMIGIFLAVDICLRSITITFHEGVSIKDRNQILNNLINFQTFLEFVGTIVLMIMPKIVIYDGEFIFTDAQIKFILISTYPQFTVLLKSVQLKQEQLNLTKQSMSLVELFKLLLLIFFIQHYCSCIWLILGQQCKLTGIPNWISANQLSIEDVSDLYLQALYYISVTMFTVGYGDIHPISKKSINLDQYEQIFAILFMFLCTFQLSYSVNTIGSILTQLKENSDQLKNKITLINQFMNNKRISHSLQLQVREFMNYNYKQQNQQNLFQQEELLQELPDELQAQIQQEASRAILNKCKFFKENFSQEFINELLKTSKFQHFQPGIVINKSALKLDETDFYISIIEKGSIAISQSLGSQEVSVTILSQDNYFGHQEFVNQSESNLIYKTQTFCTLFVISYHKFNKLLLNHQADFEKFHLIKKSFQFCHICQNDKHNTDQCAVCHFIPDYEKVIKQYQYQQPQPRRKLHRSYQRQCKFFQTLLFLEDIQEEAENIQQEYQEEINQMLPTLQQKEESKLRIKNQLFPPPQMKESIKRRRSSIIIEYKRKKQSIAQVDPFGINSLGSVVDIDRNEILSDSQITLLYDQIDKFQVKQAEEIFLLYRQYFSRDQSIILNFETMSNNQRTDTNWNFNEVIKKLQFNPFTYGKNEVTNLSRYMLFPFQFLFKYRKQSQTELEENRSKKKTQPKPNLRKMITFRKRAKVVNEQSTDL